MLDHLPSGVFALSNDGRIVEANRTLLDMLGYQPGELGGERVERILPASSRVFFHTHVLPLLRLQGAVEEFYLPFAAKDGREVPMLLNGRRLEAQGAGGALFVAMRMLQRYHYENEILQMRNALRDANERLEASLEQIRELARQDELTKTLNRRAVLERLGEERERSLRSGVHFSIALIDLDHFKAINDTWGHLAGDAVLVAFADRARRVMRATDALGRFGGEEFLAVFAGATPGEALHALERIRAATAQADWGAIGQGLQVTLSAGVAGYRRGEQVSDLLQRADASLYEAKRGGRDRIVAAP